MDPREEELRLEGEHSQMGIDQVEKLARKKMSLNLFTDGHKSPPPPMGSHGQSLITNEGIEIKITAWSSTV